MKTYPRQLVVKLLVEDSHGLSRSETAIINDLGGPNVHDDRKWRDVIERLSCDLATQMSFEFDEIR